MTFYLKERKKNSYLNKNIKTYAKQYFEEELKSEWQIYKEQRRLELEKELNEGIRIEKKKEEEQLDFLHKEKAKRQEEIDSDLRKYQVEKKQEIENSLQKLLEIAIEDYNRAIEDRKKQLENYYESTTKQANEYREKMQKELDQLLSEIEDYYKKREVINEDILRNKKIQQETDFYRTCLSEEDKLDIDFLRGVAKKIHHPDAINKLIWDVYIKRAVDTLIKNVLNNESICGIYKFTNIDTGEIYIGKSTDIKKRAYEHYKYAFGLSGIASSNFHYALTKCGIDRFTFELLEQCEKDKLTEREKYYITFYESNKYGYNQRTG